MKISIISAYKLDNECTLYRNRREMETAVIRCQWRGDKYNLKNKKRSKCRRDFTWKYVLIHRETKVLIYDSRSRGAH